MNHALMSVKEKKRDLNTLGGEKDDFRQPTEKRKF